MKILGQGDRTYIVEMSSKEIHHLLEAADAWVRGSIIEVGKEIEVPNFFAIRQVIATLQDTLEALTGVKKVKTLNETIVELTEL